MDAFEAHRPHLHAVATRILGSRAEADDALQEAWLRIDRADPSDVNNIGGWLTTVVSRVCLTMLDARKRRREEALRGGRPPHPPHTAPPPAPRGPASAGRPARVPDDARRPQAPPRGGPRGRPPPGSRDHAPGPVLAGPR